MKSQKKILTAALVAVAAITLVIATVFTTIAYLTASTAVSNTFTVGNVNIAMYESKVDANGQKIADDAAINGNMKDSDGNNYHLVTGKTYDKDPTVYVDPASEKSYLFIKIRNNISPIELGNFLHSDETTPRPDDKKPTIAEQMAQYGWMLYSSGNTGDVYVYVGNVDSANAKNGVLNGNLLTGDALAAVKAKTATPAMVGGTGMEQVINVFDTFTIDEHAEQQLPLYAGAKVTLTAFAIQSASFVDDPETADVNEALVAAWQAIVDKYPYENG